MEKNLKRKNIKVGVVGVGNMGINHARLYSELADVELVGILDVDKKRGKKVANKFNTVFFTNPLDLIRQVDAVSIVVPTKFHYKVAKLFLERKIDVLIEKPITSNLKEAEELINLGKKNNSIIQVGHVERFNPVVKEFKKFIQPEDIFTIEAVRVGPFGSKRIIDTGVVLDLMIHDIDIILNLINQGPQDIVEIHAFGRKEQRKYEDLALAILRFRNGIIVSLKASWISARRIRKLKIDQKENYIIVDFTKKTLEVYRQKEMNYIVENGKFKFQHTETIERPYISQEEPLKLELQSFLDCVRNRTSPLVGGSVAKNTLSVALKILSKIK